MDRTQGRITDSSQETREETDLTPTLVIMVTVISLEITTLTSETIMD